MNIKGQVFQYRPLATLAEIKSFFEELTFSASVQSENTKETPQSFLERRLHPLDPTESDPSLEPKVTPTNNQNKQLNFPNQEVFENHIKMTQKQIKQNQKNLQSFLTPLEPHS